MLSHDPATGWQDVSPDASERCDSGIDPGLGPAGTAQTHTNTELSHLQDAALDALRERCDSEILGWVPGTAGARSGRSRAGTLLGKMAEVVSQFCHTMGALKVGACV